MESRQYEGLTGIWKWDEATSKKREEMLVEETRGNKGVAGLHD